LAEVYAKVSYVPHKKYKISNENERPYFSTLLDCNTQILIDINTDVKTWNLPQKGQRSHH